MADSAIKLRVKWDTTKDFAQTGAELSGRLLALETSRGRDYASQLVGKSVAGRLVAILNNNSGDYSPFNTGSPLTGNVVPEREVRLTATGRAAQFTAANSEFLSIADNASLSTGDIDFTIALWVYLDSKPSAEAIVGKWDGGGGREYLLQYVGGGTDRFRLSVFDGSVVQVVANNFGSPTTGAWHFLVCWHDASANTLNIQVNNGTVDSTAHSGGVVDGAAAFALGSNHGGTSAGPFDGRMVAFGFWKKVLTAAETTFLYHDGDGVRYKDIGLTGDGSALKTSLEAWLDLQEASGNRADSEGSNTLTDNATVTDAEGIPNYSLWKGFIEDVEPLPSLGGLNPARLTAIGPLGQVNLNKIRLAMATSELTGTAVGRVLTEAGWATADRTIDAGKTTMARFWVENEVRTITVLRRIERTETGFIGESPDGRIVFEDRRHRQLSPHTTSQATFSDAPGAALAYSGLRELDSRQQLFHIFSVIVQTYTTGSLAVLWTLSSSGSDSPAIEPGETLTFWAEHPNPVSPTNAFGVDAWTTPVENTDYEANTQSGGGGIDSSGDLALTITKFGNSMKNEIKDNAAVKVFLTLLQARGTPITRDDPSRVSVETAAAHPRTFPDPPEYLPDVGEAFDWANWHNNVFSVIQPLLSMDVIGNRSDATFKETLGLDISDRIAIVATNDAGLGINTEFFIESINHFWNIVNKTQRTTFGLSEAVSQDAWTLGTSKLGTGTRLAYT